MEESLRKMSIGLLLVMTMIGLSDARYELSVSGFPQTFVVGGDAGWRVGYDYKSWGNEVPVHVGDVLEFSYTIGEHSLTLVKDWESFENCDTSDPLQEYEDGDTSIEVKEAGWMYFVDAYGTHCEQGVKMAIKVQP